MIYFFEHHGMKGKDFFKVNEMREQSFPAHLHRAYELIYVTNGTLQLQVEERTYQMNEGDLAFIFNNQIHQFTASAGTVLHVVLYSPELIGSFFSSYRDYVPENNVIHLKQKLNFFECNSIYQQKSLLYYVCAELLKSTEMMRVRKNAQTAIIQQIFAYVDQHYQESCSLKEISQELQYDYAYLSKLFVRMTKMRFLEYLNHYRISQACYLLKEQQYSVTEIAARCGYTNMRSFYRNFRELMGCSPKEYKT